MLRPIVVCVGLLDILDVVVGVDGGGNGRRMVVAVGMHG